MNRAYAIGDVQKRLRFRRWLRNAVAGNRTLYMAMARQSANTALLAADTELVIEGFPRCANSFAEAAFRLAQPRPVRLAHHAHAAAHVLAAVRARVPTLVLIREPDRAVASLIARNPEVYRPQDCYREYIDFYTRIRPAAAGFVVADFAEATGDFGAVIARINACFGTGFALFVSSEDTIRRAYELIDALALERIGRITPYSDKHGAAFRAGLQEFQRSVQAEILNPRYEQIRGRALHVYRDFKHLAAEDTRSGPTGARGS